MSRVHTGELSPLAIKRLRKEAEAWSQSDDTITSQGTISACPYKDDFSRWCANVILADGAYAGTNFHIYIEVPPNYPATAPSAYFKSSINYTSGAQYEVEGKGISICLDLLGNFAFVHSEWATSGEASGWSPSYTISTILITLQGALPDMLRKDRVTVQNTQNAAKGCRCACGHKGNQNIQYFPPLTCFTKKAEDTKNPSTASVTTTTSSASLNSLPEEISHLLSTAPQEKLQQIILQHLAEETIRKALITGDDKEEEEEPSPSLSLAHLVCYATGCNPVSDPEEIFGFGVRVEMNGLIETPAEVLTYSAFESGVKRSTTNQNLDFFLPIFVSLEHWTTRGAFELFKKSITEIFRHTTRLHPNQFPAAPVQAAMILCSLMNSTCLAAEQAGSGEQTANDRFINGYFTLLRLFKGLANSIPGVREYAEQRLGSFKRSDSFRSKDPIRGCPNLGEFLLFLHVSKKFTWKDISLAFMEESDIRRVRWYLKDYPFLADLEAYCPDRHQLTFLASETSRRLICFQVKFLLLSQRVSLNDFADGAVPEELLQAMKALHHQITNIKCWNDYNRFVGLPTTTDMQLNQQLVEAVRKSAAKGYHWSKDQQLAHRRQQAPRAGRGDRRGRGLQY